MKPNDLTAYNKIKDSMHTGDVVHFAGNDILGRTIRLFTPRSHTALVIRLKDYEGDEKRRFILEANGIHGISLQLLSKRLAEYNGRAWWQPLRPEFESARRYVGTKAFGLLGTKYDYAGLFRSALGRVSESMSALFCSEFAWAVIRQGIEDTVRNGTDGSDRRYSSMYSDWKKIDCKAAWPGDFAKFTETFQRECLILNV
jgi:hypothetical protein